MPLSFIRKSASPDVSQLSLKNRHTFNDVLQDKNNVLLNRRELQPRHSLNPNETGLTTFSHRKPMSVSSPNLAESSSSARQRNKRLYSASSVQDPSSCPTCSMPFDTEVRVPRILPCLHTLCTECLQCVENFLVFLSKSSPSKPPRYSWRRRSTRTLLGNFLCPLCHGVASIFLVEGIKGLPINKCIQGSPMMSANPNVACLQSSHIKLLEMAVQEMYPKLKLIQAAVEETEQAKFQLLMGVEMVERRISPLLLWHQDVLNPDEPPTPPPSPNASSVVAGQVRGSLFTNLRSIKLRRSNRLIHQQLVLEQCEIDLQFLCSVISQMTSIVCLSFESEEISSDLVQNISVRFSILEATLNNIGLASSESQFCYETAEEIVNSITSELTGSFHPLRCYADVKSTMPLYEKVVCQIQLLVIDKENRPATAIDLEKISGGLMLKQDIFCQAVLKQSNTLGVVVMEMIPTCSGLADVEIIYTGHLNQKHKLEVRPSSVLVRPLVLDTEYHPIHLKKRTSCKSRDSAKTISL